MWRRIYLVLALVRLWLALSPSYLHPDEHFQGPEVIAGQIFGYPVRRTWEFTSNHPIRSVFPLWPVYGLPMLLLRWIWAGDVIVAPVLVFWCLRVLMFVLSFVLEDWALHELVESPRHRRVALLLVASSYVTWSYQTHTFSNSIETVVVAWSLVLIRRLAAAKQRASLVAAALLGVVAVFGLFNRITFPAFLLVPAVQLLPLVRQRPLALVVLGVAAVLTTALAILLDTAFYTPTTAPLTWSTLLLSTPIITPWNNLAYNANPDNLAKHGLHPWYQHSLANLPLLLGPAMALLVFLRPRPSIRLYSALSGIGMLSLFAHQEARFLLPAVPLLLSSVRLPKNQTTIKIWSAAWVIFNVCLGMLMGVYHQAGVVPAQVFLSTQSDATNAVWWKTYMPPIWLLNGKSETLHTEDVMGMSGDQLIQKLGALATCALGDGNGNYLNETTGTYLVAPASADWLDPYLANDSNGLHFREVWHHTRHLNLDDLEWADDGVWNTLARVVGRRGLVAWRVTRTC